MMASWTVFSFSFGNRSIPVYLEKEIKLKSHRRCSSDVILKMSRPVRLIRLAPPFWILIPTGFENWKKGEGGPAFGASYSNDPIWTVSMSISEIGEKKLLRGAMLFLYVCTHKKETHGWEMRPLLSSDLTDFKSLLAFVVVICHALRQPVRSILQSNGGQLY